MTEQPQATDQIGEVDPPVAEPAPQDTPHQDTPRHDIELKDPLRGSKASGIYAGVIGLGIVLVLLIVFIAQNTQHATIHFLWLDGRAPVAVMLLIATAAGLFLAGFASLLRIIQLRSRVKHERKARKRAAA